MGLTKMKILIILLLFSLIIFTTTMQGMACEHGWTAKNQYGKPNSYDFAVMSDGGAYYFPNGSVENKIKGTIWKRIHFKGGKIVIATPYTGVMFAEKIGRKHFPKDNTKIPYVLYKGARWYSQYHGFIYVYEDGEEFPKREK